MRTRRGYLFLGQADEVHQVTPHYRAADLPVEGSRYGYRRRSPCRPLPQTHQLLSAVRLLAAFRAGSCQPPFQGRHLIPGGSEPLHFDRELRLLVLDAIERVEISVRTQWAYHFSHQYGPHGYLEHQHFKQDRHGWHHGEQLQRFAQEAAHSKEDFIVHLLRQYEEDLPPLWAAVEIMSLGHLSKWIANLKHGKDRNRIARTYGMDETILVSFLHHLSIVRNLCAHHSRLWNREFTFTFRLPKRTPVPVAPVINWRAKRKLYNTLAMMTWFLDCICLEHHFRQRLTNLIGKHGIDTSAMGFPENWRELGFWNGTQDE